MNPSDESPKPKYNPRQCPHFKIVHYPLADVATCEDCGTVFAPFGWSGTHIEQLPNGGRIERTIVTHTVIYNGKKGRATNDEQEDSPDHK